MAGPVIDIVRHAEAENNVLGHETRDPGLTSEGKGQCQELRDSYPHMERVKLVVSSPLRRALQTTGIAFAAAAEAAGTDVVLHPDLQENSARPSDTGSPLSTVLGECLFRVDATLMGGNERWYSKAGTGSRYFPALEKVEERARAARVWLRDRARELQDGDRLVVLSHGAFLHFLTQDFAGLDVNRGSGVWLNADYRSFEFADLEGNDTEATLVERQDSQGIPARPWCELTEEERALQKGYAIDRLRRHEEEALVAQWRRRGLIETSSRKPGRHCPWRRP
ncbi:histidine phosphatase superfamily [Nemania sp. NC0429]|nr:histidine phosphatase superfamily [Nemania sp. NC0429]